MKKLFGVLLALCASAAFAATTVPIQLLNPAGSTAGQAIVSAGPTSAPAWGSVPLSGTATITGGTSNGMVIGNSTQAAGAFTTLIATGLIMPTSTVGIKGTVTNDSPAAGSVGENPVNSTTGTSLANNTPANCTSVPLTTGNWLVYGNVTFIPNTSPATTISQVVANISTTSATLAAPLTSVVTTFTAGTQQAVPVPMVPLKLSTNTTVFLVGQAQFATSTMTCNGNIGAIRIR